ncbi:MAG: polysaccharide deacetylase family protein [Chloroflexota bacterium]
MLEIAQALKDQGMPSTFFVNGGTSLDTLQKIKDMGHIIGLHGMRHADKGIPADAEWYHTWFNVTNDITALRDKLAIVLGPEILLRAPGGGFAPVDIFKHSDKWKPYQDAYFYGWDYITPYEQLSDEPGFLITALSGGIDPAIIVVHANQSATKESIVTGHFKKMLADNGYTNFDVLPGSYPGTHTGYDENQKPMGSASSWASDIAELSPHMEENGEPVKLP